MATKSKRRVWVNPRGAALSFLPKLPAPEPPTPQRERECELQALDHGIEVGKRRSEIAVWDKKARDAARDLPDERTRRREAATRARIEEVELKLEELEAKAAFAEEKVTRVQTKAFAIYRSLHMLRREKRTRIRELLDAYELDESILPLAIQELLKEDEYDDDSV